MIHPKMSWNENFQCRSNNMCVCLYVCDVMAVVVSTRPTARANLENGCKGPIPPLFLDLGRRTSTLGRSRIDSSFEPQDVLPPLQACAQDIIEMMPRRFVGGYGSGDAAARDSSILAHLCEQLRCKTESPLWTAQSKSN
jgi:hypothetical protein